MQTLKIAINAKPPSLRNEDFGSQNQPFKYQYAKIRDTRTDMSTAGRDEITSVEIMRSLILALFAPRSR